AFGGRRGFRGVLARLCGVVVLVPVVTAMVRSPFGSRRGRGRGLGFRRILRDGGTHRRQRRHADRDGERNRPAELPNVPLDSPRTGDISHTDPFFGYAIPCNTARRYIFLHSSWPALRFL